MQSTSSCRSGSLACLPPQRQALLGKPFHGGRAPLLTARKHVRPTQLTWSRGRPACRAAQQQNSFSSERELQGIQATLAGMPSAVFYGAITLLVAAAGAAGYNAGGRAPEHIRSQWKLGGAAIGGVAMVAAGKNLQEQRGEAAGVKLHNELVRRGGPNNVTREDIDALAQRYGISRQQAYGLYLEALIPQGGIPQGGAPSSGDEPRDEKPRDESLPNEEAWQQGNETYKKRFGNKGVLKSPPRKKVAVVGCMDARFHVEKALALEEGDAHIIRNAGGRVSEDVIRSLAISQQLLGTEEVAVIHHTDCGMATFEDPTLVEKLDANLGPEAAATAKNMKFLNFFGVDLEESVRVDLRALKESPLLTPASKNKLSGYIYDVKSGGLQSVPMSNEEAWQKGNETYKKRFGNKGVLKSPPSKKVAVVACMDARFHVEKALALNEGDAHIIRNAGGRVSEDVIRSLAISQQLLGTEEVAVIHHTDCGMATFEDPTLVQKLDANLGPEAAATAKKMKFLNFFGVDLEESVRIDIKALKDSPLLTPASKNKLTGYIYDVKSGGLWTVPA